MTPGESRAKARESVISGSIDALATRLKENYGMIQDALPETVSYAPEESEAYRGMARELIEKRSLTLTRKDGKAQTLTLAEIDRLDDEKGGGALKNAFGVDSIAKIVPRKDQIEAIADSVGNAAEENTGTVGFLGGATVMNALKGLFTWLIGLFTGESSFSMQSLRDTIGKASADETRESVEHNLAQLQQKRPDLQPFLTDDTIRQIGGRAQDEVTRIASGQPPPEGDALASVRQKPLEESQVNAVRQQIKTEILNPKDGERLEDTIASAYQKAIDERPWYERAFAPGSEEVHASSHKVANAIAQSVSEGVVDGGLAGLPKEEYAASVAERVGKDLKKREEEFGLAFKLSDTDENTGKTQLETITDQVRARVAENYDRLRPASSMGERHAIEVAKEQAREAVQGNQVSYNPGAQPLIPGEDLGRVNTPGNVRDPNGPALA